MKTSVRFVAVFGILVLGVSLSSGAIGQERPSLAVLTDALCAMADRNLDSYRPLICEPRCDCLSPFLVYPITSCAETSPGRFEAQLTAYDDNICKYVDFGGSGGGYICLGSSCATSADCPTDYGCFELNDLGSYCQAAPLNSPSQCQGASDCPPYPIAFTAVLDDVVSVTSGEPVACIPNGAPSIGISSVDANECLSQIEAASGLDCGFRCGNGLIDTAQGETCDDGNTTPGDGCDATCQVEP